MKYGYKLVVKSGDFYEGIVIENAGDGSVVARKYFKNEYGEMMQGEIITVIDFVVVAWKKTPIGKMREITKQLGHGDFAIDEQVIKIIE